MNGEKILQELNDAMVLGGEIRRRTKGWDMSCFLALVGVLVDQRAADDGRDSRELWDDLYSVAQEVNQYMGPMKGAER